MRTLKIIAGPDKLALSYSLMEGDNKIQQSVRFLVQEQDKAKTEWVEFIKLNSVQREDGSGHNFNLTGYNAANHAHVKIFFNINKRAGTMTFD